jgi:ribosomal protein S27E
MREVIEDEERGVVIVDGVEIEGHVEDIRCPACDERKIYYDRYDAYFCAVCNSWLESNCGDPECDYCRDRPAAPLADMA